MTKNIQQHSDCMAALMTNAELATAIDYAAARCSQYRADNTKTSSTDLGKEFFNHLKCLLYIQRERAALLEIPESGDE